MYYKLLTFHVEHKNYKMEIAEVFLVFGEKCQELQDAGHHTFFEYSGNVDCYFFKSYNGKFAGKKKLAICEQSNEFLNISEFIETSFHQANLLMHRPEDFKVLPPQINRKS